MRTLIYKRTHPGDPDREGRFGIHDCMGRVRAWPFEAVIGVGGIGSEPELHGLAGKVNWIGIGAHRLLEPGRRGPIVTFDHFLFYGADGPSFLELAPRLASRIYSLNVRTVMNLGAQEQAEAEQLLLLAKSAPPSSAGSAGPLPPSQERRLGTGAARKSNVCGSCNTNSGR